MFGARELCSCIILLIYIQSTFGQQVLGNQQNVGNNVLGSRNGNSMNQISNGGFNNGMQSNSQLTLQSNGQQMNFVPNVQYQGSRPEGAQATQSNQRPNERVNPIVAHLISAIQARNNANGNKQNAQMQPQQNKGPNLSEIMNTKTSNSLSDITGLKGQAIMSLLSQGNGACQQNQQYNGQNGQNQNTVQNQMTEAQKQYLIKSLQSQLPQNQQAINVMQQRPPDLDTLNLQAQMMTSQQPQVIQTGGNLPQYITVQAQPLTTYIQNQPPTIKEDEQSILAMLSNEFQLSDPLNSIYSTTNKGSKTSLKTLLPLIINLLKEKNCCGCHNNCGCTNNGANNILPDPTVFGGYANMKNYSQGNEIPHVTEKPAVKENKSIVKDKNNHKKQIIESEESEEDDSEYVDDSEEND